MNYKTFRSTKILTNQAANMHEPIDALILKHDERHLRRKLLHFANGNMIMLDLKETVQLKNGDILEAETGEHFIIQAAVEPLYAVKAKSALHLLELAWHLGNRHLSVQIFEDYITLLRDPVIKSMLIGLGGTVEEIEQVFHPLHGAYHGHQH